MATVEKTIVIKTDTKSSQKEVKELEKAVEGVNKEVKETTGSTEAMGGALDNVTGGAITKFKAFTGTLKGVTSGFKTMRLAIISTGLGALVVIIGSLIAAFSGSEEGQNKFAKLTTIIGAAVGNLVDLLADLGENLISAFENPQKALKDFTKLIKDNLINRFEGLLELVPKLGKAVSLLFEGEFSRAGKVAADAVGKVTLGVDSITDSFESAKEGVKGFIKEQQKELKQAASVADMRAKADKIERKLIVDRSKLESEIANLRLKSRQEEEFSAAERKQALLDAQVLEDQLLDKETEFLELRRDAQILENTFSRSNKENLTKEAEAIAAVNRQQASRANTARQVQREVNTISKQIEAENKRIANEEKAEKDKIAADEKLRLDSIQKIRDEFEAKQKEKEAETELEKLALEEEKKLAELEDLEATEEQKFEIIKYYSNLKTDLEEKENKKKEELEKLRTQQTLGDAKNTFNQIANLAGKDSKVGKALALASATISGVEGVQNAYTTAQKSPITAVFPAYPIIQAALAGAVAAKNIATIKKTDPTGGGSATSVSTSTASASTPSLPPSFNIVGASDTNQLADAIGGQTQQPVQAFVVANDVTTAQSLENNIVEGATLG
tara:strand:+ start:13583 stop:15427 length:1845 start_codon:yes stop_codon:yes gene_type:complete